MPRSSAALRPLAPSTLAPWYPNDLLAELQSTLATLADIEVRYEADRERLEEWAGPEAIKEKFAAQLESAINGTGSRMCNALLISTTRP
jgi:hypothetical protein